MFHIGRKKQDKDPPLLRPRNKRVFLSVLAIFTSARKNPSRARNERERMRKEEALTDTQRETGVKVL